MSPTNSSIKTKALVQAGWVHAPHLTPEIIEEFKKSTPPHLLDARMNGNPTMGAGNVYPVPVSDFKIDPIPIQDYWKKWYAMDVGWKVTAAVFGAYDTHTDTIYIYHEYYGREEKPPVHASAIKAVARDWMPGLIDPASHGRSSSDGAQLIHLYRKEGLKVRNADNSVEAGIASVLLRLSTNRLKVFKNCFNLFKEYESYRRDEDGKIIKEKDHLMDCLRYLCMGLKYASFPKSHYAGANSNQQVNPYAF